MSKPKTEDGGATVLCPTVTPPDRRYGNHKWTIFGELFFPALSKRAEGKKDRKKDRKKERRTDGRINRKKTGSRQSKKGRKIDGRTKQVS